jgi:hypothetical protein
MYVRVAIAWAVAALSWLALALPAGAAGYSNAQLSEAMDVAMHDAIFTLYHESGHLLIDELKLPVLGKEEDAADALAVLQILKNTPDKKELIRTLNDVADEWYYSSLRATPADLTGYDRHSLDIQRANAMICLMVGADPASFARKAEARGLGVGDRDDCADDYRRTLDAWTTVLAPHLASKPGAEIKVTYGPADDDHLQRFADALQSRHILEGIAEQLRRTYALPQGISIVAKECSEANSYYLADEHQILYCYELADDIYGLTLDNRFGDGTTIAHAATAPPGTAMDAPDLSSRSEPSHAANSKGGGHNN